jgi:hypothetical protein
MTDEIGHSERVCWASVPAIKLVHLSADRDEASVSPPRGLAFGTAPTIVDVPNLSSSDGFGVSRQGVRVGLGRVVGVAGQ